MFTEDDLYRTYIRAQNSKGEWGNINLRDASDEQFSAWAKGRIPIQGDATQPWSVEERIDFCRFVEATQGELVKIVKD